MAKRLLSTGDAQAIADLLEIGNATDIRRVVIDIQAGQAVVYVEKHSNPDRVIQVITGMAGAEIKIEDGG